MKMGYNVNMDISLSIQAEKTEAALMAIRKYNDGNSNDTEDTLSEELSNWGFECWGDDDSDAISYVYWEGEKWGDQEELLKALAPFVDEGCAVRCVGEDGYIWGYAFKEGKLWGVTYTAVTDEEPIT